RQRGIGRLALPPATGRSALIRWMMGGLAITTGAGLNAAVKVAATRPAAAQAAVPVVLMAVREAVASPAAAKDGAVLAASVASAVSAKAGAQEATPARAAAAFTRKAGRLSLPMVAPSPTTNGCPAPASGRR